MAPWEGSTLEPSDKRDRPFDSDSVLAAGKFKDRPTDNDNPVKTSTKWINGKKIDDEVGPYWRIHDKLYDLTEFIHKHPGGEDWISITKGTDITEAFESSHISSAAEKMLPKYFVKDIKKPRNSPYTFHEDGFFRTLKRKVRPVLAKIGKGATRKICFMQDFLMMAFAGLAIIGSILFSYPLIVLSGIFLAWTMMCAHNFFHQRDNFRMYYFDLSLLSSYDWRISHGLSHHLFTNTRYDMEVTALEPLVVFLPKEDKSFLQRYGPLVYQFMLIPFAFFGQLLARIYSLLSRQLAPRPEFILIALELLVMCRLAPSLGDGIRLWLVLHASCSTWFTGIGLIVAHHHPEIYHEGDKLRKNPDWGLCQLDAVRDRIEVRGNLFLVATTFGDHSLHHLFPTVDHSKLEALYPAFFETCREFNIPFEFLSQWDLAVGSYKQLAKNTPTLTEPGYKCVQKD